MTWQEYIFSSALFESIEKHDIDELRKILGTIDVNINE